MALVGEVLKGLNHEAEKLLHTEENISLTFVLPVMPELTSNMAENTKISALDLGMQSPLSLLHEKQVEK